MGSSDGTNTVVTEASDLTFPAADVDTELNPGDNNNFEVDPISSEVATSLDMKAEEIKAKEREDLQRKEALQTLKTTIVVSAVVVAVAGAVFAIVKKLRET